MGAEEKRIYEYFNGKGGGIFKTFHYFGPPWVRGGGKINGNFNPHLKGERRRGILERFQFHFDQMKLETG